MKVKATWVSKNPFLPDFRDLAYTKTVEVPDGTDLKDIEEFAKQDSRRGYTFKELEVIDS